MINIGVQNRCPALVGISRAIREVVELIDTVAQSDCCVLIEGESGTGKELAARRLHAMSPRNQGPFIPVNCAGISETLFESQFFGHVRGAFTGAEQTMKGLVRSAEGGTLFMDEVGEIPLNLQAKLLRVLQDGEVLPVGTSTPVPVDTRFVAATNRSLRQQVARGEFREDLFYRFNVVRICLPPLREHPEDIPVLLDHFLAVFARKSRRPAAQISQHVRNQLCEYTWPGNVRELMCWVERLYATGLSPEVLAASLLADRPPTPDPTPSASPGNIMTLEQAERHAITQALEATGHNRTRAARLLGINRGTLLRKIARLQLY